MAVILECPVCRNLLLNSADGYQCANHHTFDAAREGYVNLLPANRKNSREPGDSPDMIRSRRRFLDLGLYDKVSDDVNEAVAGNLVCSGIRDAFNILDAGCGEGFYLRRLKEHLSLSHENCPIDYFGLDISKFAVRSAAKRDRVISWLVASIVGLPFAPTSLDMIVNIFSPASIPEFSRVLKKGGCLVIATPGPRHLNSLREIIYPVAREHSQSAFADQARGSFSLSEEARVKYQLELKDKESIMDLLSMTPYFWNIDLKTKSRVEALEHLALDVDVEIRVFRKTG